MNCCIVVYILHNFFGYARGKQCLILHLIPGFYCICCITRSSCFRLLVIGHILFNFDEK